MLSMVFHITHKTELALRVERHCYARGEPYAWNARKYGEGRYRKRGSPPQPFVKENTLAGGSIGAPAGQGHSTPQPGCDGLQAFAGAKRAKHRKGQEVAVLHPFHRTGIGRRVL